MLKRQLRTHRHQQAFSWISALTKLPDRQPALNRIPGSIHMPVKDNVRHGRSQIRDKSRCSVQPAVTSHEICWAGMVDAARLDHITNPYIEPGYIFHIFAIARALLPEADMAFRFTESRPYDVYLDPVYTTKSSRPPYRSLTTVSGSARCKYFQRPMVPQLDAVPPSVLLAPTKTQDPLQTNGTAQKQSHNVSIQTIYREEEAQTDPYSPDYVLAGDVPPQVLLLKEMSFAGGHLPVGIKEVEMIEHAKAKQRLMSSLPPATDEASLALRKRLLELQEMRELAIRQRQIDEAHEARLTELDRALVERDAEADFVIEQRIEAMRQRYMEKRDRSLDCIQAQRLKVLRKLSIARGKLRMPSSLPVYGHRRRRHRDIIEEYASYASRVYAPMKREGQLPDKTSQVVDVSTVAPMLATSAGILDVLAGQGIPAKLTSSNAVKPFSNAHSTPGVSTTQRKDQQLTADLLKMTARIERQKAAAAASASSNASPGSKNAALSLPSKYHSASNPPSTPGLPVTDESEELLDQALVLLQRLLRGRAVQNEMFEGKKRRHELIKELRVPTSTTSAGKQQSNETHAVFEKAAFEAIAGETTSALLDKLAQELQRREEKEHIETIVRRADAERRRREAEEAETRQAEETVRERTDEAYRQVMRAHFETARSYVDEIVELALEECARREALAELCDDDEFKVQLENQLEAARIDFVHDLVASFLGPAIDKWHARQHTHEAEKHLTHAAQDVICDSVRRLTEHVTMDNESPPESHIPHDLPTASSNAPVAAPAPASVL